MSKLTKQEIASLGGTAVYKKYGSSYMAAIGRKGYLVMKAKYDVVPYGTSDFAIVSRKTGRILALMSGKKLQSDFSSNSKDIEDNLDV